MADCGSRVELSASPSSSDCVVFDYNDSEAGGNSCPGQVFILQTDILVFITTAKRALHDF